MPSVGAGLEPQRLDALDHGADRLQIAILRRAPRRAHAEAARPGRARGTRLDQHRLDLHQLVRLHPGVVTRALWAIGRNLPGSRRF